MKNNFKVEFEDKYLGAFLGAAVGDAIGWPQEDRSMRIGKSFKPNPQFQKWYRRGGNRFSPYEEVIDPGSYSDDTQLLFATARSLENKNWFSHFVKIELPTWLLYERGGGGSYKKEPQICGVMVTLPGSSKNKRKMILSAILKQGEMELQCVYFLTCLIHLQTLMKFHTKCS